VERPTIKEITALGAAYLAGLAVGYWKDQQEISTQWSIDHTFEPTMNEPVRDGLYNGWKKAVFAAMAFK
jgi:glycerol kinase